jgi:hypothetical protein
MNSEKRESGSVSSSGGAPTIQVAAATALKESDQLCSVKLVRQEELDIESARIAHKKPRHQGHDLVVQRRRDDLARLLTKIRRGEAGYELAKKFLAGNIGSPPEPPP